MAETFIHIQQEYLKKVWSRPIPEIEEALPARYQDNLFHLQAFGESCELHPQKILLAGEPVDHAVGILIAMYASSVTKEAVQLHPLKAFKQFQGAMGYQAAFHTNAERALIPHVEEIQKRQEEIIARFSGFRNEEARRCDFSFTLFPLPKIPLYYIFNLPDEEFPASVTCLFASNADHFMPVAGLADTAEYTAKKILQGLS